MQSEDERPEYKNIEDVLDVGTYGMDAIESFCAVWKHLVLFARYVTLSLILLSYSIYLMFVSTDAWIWILKQNYPYAGNDSKSADAVKQQDVMNVLYTGSLIFGGLMLCCILTSLGFSWRNIAKSHYTLTDNYYVFRFIPLLLVLNILFIAFYCMAWSRAVLFVDCSKPVPYTGNCYTVAHYGAVLTLIFTGLYSLLLMALGAVVYFCLVVKVKPIDVSQPPSNKFFSVSKCRNGTFAAAIESVIGLKRGPSMNYKNAPTNVGYPLLAGSDTLYVK